MGEGVRECVEVLHDDFIPGVLMIGCTLVYFSMVDIYLCLGSFAWVCLHVTLAYYLSRSTIFYTKEHTRIGNERTKVTMDFLKNYEIIQIYLREFFAKKKMHDISSIEVDLYQKYLMSNTIATVSCALLMVAFQGVFFAIVLFSIKNQLDTSSVFALFNMNLWFTYVVWDRTEKVLNMIQSFGQMMKSIEIINNAMDCNTPTGKIEQIEDSTIMISNLSFSYSANNHHHLTKTNEELVVFKNLNFTLNPGEKMALIGPSGCGKSTLLKILTHLIDIDHSVYIGNHLISEYNTSVLRNNIAFVPQANDILDISILENITMGIECSNEQLEYVYEKSKINEFLPRLPNGVNTLAKYLSGGQKQRVNIARAILHTIIYPNTKYVFLDEPVSALDKETSDFIVQMIYELSEGRTLICIDHSYYFCRYMNKIGVFQKDKTIKMYTYDEWTKEIQNTNLP
jgi:ABC-type multidrug transport system fused ATPase/permease subunit